MLDRPRGRRRPVATFPWRGKQIGPVLKASTIELGQRFVKTDVPSVVWTVEKLFQLPAEPPHARLFKEARPRDKITVSVGTLVNPRFFRRAAS